MTWICNTFLVIPFIFNFQLLLFFYSFIFLLGDKPDKLKECKARLCCTNEILNSEDKLELDLAQDLFTSIWKYENDVIKKSGVNYLPPLEIV